VQRQRAVNVTGAPAEPPTVVHVAQGVATVLVFESQVNGAAVEVDRERVKILDDGNWSLVFEPLVEPNESLLLSVPFTESKAGARAVFLLVSSPAEVDTRLDVVWLKPTVEECQAQLAEAQARCSKSSPIRFLRDGWLARAGVSARDLNGCGKEAAAGGLRCTDGAAYRADTWVLVAVTLFNKPGQPPWVPRAVTLKSVKTGALLKPRAVELEAARLAPGATAGVFLEAELPPSEDAVFTLEIRDAEGRGLMLGTVDLSKMESKR
jgi:uncharacterized protein (TIGR02268 family)